VINPRRASEQTKLDLAQLDPSNEKPLPWRRSSPGGFQRVLNKDGWSRPIDTHFPRQPEADSNQL